MLTHADATSIYEPRTIGIVHIAAKRRASITEENGDDLTGNGTNTIAMARQTVAKFGQDRSPAVLVFTSRGGVALERTAEKTLGFETPAERFSACIASTN
jgi:hypothetical protein